MKKKGKSKLPRMKKPVKPKEKIEKPGSENKEIKRGWSAIPNVMLASDKVSPGAKLLFIVLYSYADQDKYCWPSWATMSQWLGISRIQIWRYLNELKKVDWIIQKGNQKGKAQTYELIWPKWMPWPKKQYRSTAEIFDNPYKKKKKSFYSTADLFK